MAFPVGWPPRPSSGLRSVRVYIAPAGAATGLFSDNAFLFSKVAHANTFMPTPYVPPGGERVTVNLGTPTTMSGSPMGGGQEPTDSNPDPRMNPPVVPPPVPMLWAKVIRITNLGGAPLNFSFDGTNVHGVVEANAEHTYWDRYEAGIALQGSTHFVVEAW